MSDERRNLSMQREIHELPNGLYLLRDIGDEFKILYPGEVLEAIDAAFDERLLAEKTLHVGTLDRFEKLRERIERLETRLAASTPSERETPEQEHSSP